jgi:hypothetical protein
VDGARSVAAANRPERKTGPVLPPTPFQVPAGVSRPRSVPNWLLSEQALSASNPVNAKASFDISRQTSTGQAPLPSVGRLSGKPATILEHPPGKPVIVPVGPFSTGRTRFPDRPFLSGRTLQVPSGLPPSKLIGRPFALPSAEASSPAGLRKSGFGFGLPLRLALLPGCPTRASLVSFPKDLDPLCTGGVSEFLPVSGWSLLTAKCQCAPVGRFAKAESACG